MNDLKLIKNKYGEKMMHLCREFFPTLLETPGLLFKLLSDNFAYNKFLYEDIISERKEIAFKDYIYSLIEEEKEEIVVDKTPQELLSDAGYILYECKTEEDIQKFKKYYEEDEELCTFDGGRLNSCYVFFAIKKNVDEIKRENFNNPERQDGYGTSVISVQFTRGKRNTLSIKNRYNHTVMNPDATFGNNLDNIIEGLTASFEKKYNLNINKNNQERFPLNNYVRANNGKYYKYNYEIANIYYCINNIIIDRYEPLDIYEQKEKYLLFDYFILDLENKKIKLYSLTAQDSFIDNFNNINKIEIKKQKGSNNKIIYLYSENNKKQIIEINQNNQIISYQSDSVYEIKDFFLRFNETLENLQLPNVIKIGNVFLPNNDKKINLYFPKVMSIGDNFLRENGKIDIVNFTELEMVGHNFLRSADICEVNLPKLKKTGNNFLELSHDLKEINLPELIEVGDSFLYSTSHISKLNIPKLKKAGSYFLFRNLDLKEISFPKLIEVGDGFIEMNSALTKVNFPKLKYVGDLFLWCNVRFNDYEIKTRIARSGKQKILKIKNGK